MKKNIALMAFGKGKDSQKEISSRKLYVGVAALGVVAINPTADEIAALYGSEKRDEPVYVSTVESRSTKQPVLQAKITMYLKTNPDSKHCKGIETMLRHTFVINNEFKYSTNGDKISMVNKYGEFAYLNTEDVEHKTIPVNMHWFSEDGVDIRAAYNGEEALTKFLKAYLGISNKSWRDKDTHEIKYIDDLTAAYGRLDNIQDIFKGNFTDIKNNVAILPNNNLIGMLGVREHEGKQYQVLFDRCFLKLTSRNANYLFKEVASAQSAGAYPSVTFLENDLQEFSVEKTDLAALSTTKEEVNPFTMQMGTNDAENASISNTINPFAANMPANDCVSQDVPEDLPF